MIDQATGAIELAPEAPPQYLQLKAEFLTLALEFQQKGYAIIEKAIRAMDTLGEFYPTWLEDVCHVTNTETKTLHASACRFKKAIENGWFRRELTPQHHTEVDNKKLTDNDRSELLDKAIMHGWTTPILREAVKERIGVCPQTDPKPSDAKIFQDGFYRRGDLLQRILDEIKTLPDELKAEIQKELE